jgi:sterol desaturase/sphingolipid hydroxylase (fatty acid hydroxylase superfamily)
MPIYLRYYFWLLLLSAFVFALERLFAWRRKQEVIREDLVQDLFWMVFNTQYLSWMLAVLAVHLVSVFDAAFLHFGVPAPQSLRLISHWPPWLQFVVFFLIQDLLEWRIHRWLHTVPWLWNFHKLHHSVEQLDWATAFRSHWGELIIYKTLLYVPLVVLGVSDSVIFAILVCALLIQELSHANLKWDWGPLRVVVNSPRFHAWHHDVELHGRGGQNFGVSLVIWDWLFGTAYWPKNIEAPARFGLAEEGRFPKRLWQRLCYPFVRPRAEGGDSKAIDRPS